MKTLSKGISLVLAVMLAVLSPVWRGIGAYAAESDAMVAGLPTDEPADCVFVVLVSADAAVYFYLDIDRNILSVSAANTAGEEIIPEMTGASGPFRNGLVAFSDACKAKGYTDGGKELTVNLIKLAEGIDPIFCTPMMEEAQNAANELSAGGIHVQVMNSVDDGQHADEPAFEEGQLFYTTRRRDTAVSEKLDLDYTAEAPALTVEGDRWPIDANKQQEAWQKAYPLMEQILGPACEDLFTNGITWVCNDATVSRGYAEQFPDRNTIEQYAAENGAPHALFLSNIHETGHIWLQHNNDSVKFDHGQWIWEAATIIVERVLIQEGLYPGNMACSMDLYEYLGYDALNGVVTDGCKANRIFSDFTGSCAFLYMDTVLSTPGTYDYFVKVSQLRQQYADEHDTVIIGDDAISAILDEAAGGRTIDGMKPSEWLFSRNVANIEGKDGTYLTVVGNYNDNLGKDLRVVTYAFTRKDGKETGASGQQVTIRESDAKGNVIAEDTITLEADGTHDKYELRATGTPAPNGYAAIRIEAEMTFEGATYRDVNYTLLVPDDAPIEIADNRIFLIVNDDEENLVTDLTAADIEVTGGRLIHDASLQEGLLVIEAEEGAEVRVTVGGNTYVFSKPACARIAVITK